MKKLLLSCLTTVLAVTLCIGTFTGGVYGVDDPADTYEKQQAEHEDPSLSLWFEHSFKKVMTSDITPSDMDTYSVYMAKNEIENAQFVLYSAQQKDNMTAEITAFTNEKGDTLAAELYYQMYVTVDDLDVMSVLGATSAEDSIIREGEQPDPIAPLSAIGAFQLNAGKSQAFYIRLKSTPTTPSGWYTATLNIRNAQGQQVKTAQVFAYVWDFALSEKTALDTSIYMANDTSYGGTYKAFYDYLLENRITAMDIPDGLTPGNPYLTNERVGSIRVTSNGGGWKNLYMDRNVADYVKYGDIYEELSKTNEWELIKDKFYFYTTDEPMSKEQQTAIGNPSGATIDDVKTRAKAIAKYWDDARTVVPYHENHPYPYYYYDGPLSLDNTVGIRDGAQEMFNTDSSTVLCPQVYAFTPSSELDKIGYQGKGTEKIRNLSCTISGMILKGQQYFNWERVYGDYYDRAHSYVAAAEAEGNKRELWAYSAGYNKGYTYCNHLIENTGLQTKMLFWQLYQNGVTGYLYYGANNWTEYKNENGNFVDETVTGNRNENTWYTNKHIYNKGTANEHAIYGNGTLFYGLTQGWVLTEQYIGTVRVEQMRDGIEEYQMLTMLEEYKGSDTAQAIVSKVSNNVVDYLSLNSFDTSAWSSDMDEYDIMAAVRLELGNAVEAAVKEGVCDHTYENGTVEKEAGCTTVGQMKYTCTKCGETTTEIIPAKHTEGSCFTEDVVTPVSCGKDGKVRYTCKDCGYVKEVTITKYHDDDSYYRYEKRDESVHNVFCKICNTRLSTDNHLMQKYYTNTCTEDGYAVDACRYCDYEVQGEALTAKGHYLVSEGGSEPTCTEPGYPGGACIRCDYVEEGEPIEPLGHAFGEPVIKDPSCTVNGSSVKTCSRCGFEEKTVLTAPGHDYDENDKCTVCGQTKPDYTLGDVDGDGEVTIRDIGLIRLHLADKLPAGSAFTKEQLAAADADGDGDVTVRDIGILRMQLADK